MGHVINHLLEGRGTRRPNPWCDRQGGQHTRSSWRWMSMSTPMLGLGSWYPTYPSFSRGEAHRHCIKWSWYVYFFVYILYILLGTVLALLSGTNGTEGMHIFFFVGTFNTSFCFTIFVIFFMILEVTINRVPIKRAFTVFVEFVMNREEQ